MSLFNNFPLPTNPKTMKKFRLILLALLGVATLIPVEQAAAAPRVVRAANPKPIKLPKFLLNSPVFMAFLNQYRLVDKVDPVSVHY